MADEQELRAMLADTQAQLMQANAQIVRQQVRADKAEAHVAELQALMPPPYSPPPAPPQIPPETGAQIDVPAPAVMVADIEPSEGTTDALAEPSPDASA